MNKYKVFLWDWCSQCKDAFIVCPYCKNNTCNGCFGNSDGTIGGKNPDYECPYCNLAYQYMQLCYKHGDYPKTKRQINSFNKKIKKENTYEEYK